MGFPVQIKTRNRAGLLAVTLRSLLATWPGAQPWIVDDGSDDPGTLAYLKGEQPAPGLADWPSDPEWQRYVGPRPDRAEGLPACCRVTWHRRKGIVGGHMHYARLAAERWPDAEWLLLLEDDCVFVDGWQDRLAPILRTLPPEVAFLCLYDRHDRGDETGTGWRPVKLLPGNFRGNWGYSPRELASGVAYLLRPAAVTGPEFRAEYDVSLSAGDAMIQCALARLGWQCAVTGPSLVQHTGYPCSYNAANPLRFAKHLAGPLLYDHPYTEWT